MNFIEELRWRGMLHDMTPGLEEELKRQPVPTAYIGFDPTGASLGIGNYVQIMILKVFQKHGGKPIALLGGATGRVGDPSGKNEERTLLDLNILERNINNFRRQVLEHLDFNDSPNSAEIVDNYDFYRNMDVLSFLRDVGKNVTVNYMMAKDSVKNRLESGMSFTEFSYQMLQGYDFVWLYRNKNCNIQMGGSDQWGNITTGTHMINKMEGEKAKGYAVTINLLTKEDGTKFGKTEKGNLWIDGAMTTPYEFYQFWLRASDQDSVKFNRYFTLRSVAETEATEREHEAQPGARILQKSLAQELTTRLHGEEGYQTALRVTELFYTKQPPAEGLSGFAPEVFAMAAMAVPCYRMEATTLPAEGLPLKEMVVTRAEHFSSFGDLKRAVQQNAVSVNMVKTTDENKLITAEDFVHGKYLLVRNGKEKQYLIELI